MLRITQVSSVYNSHLIIRIYHKRIKLKSLAWHFIKNVSAYFYTIKSRVSQSEAAVFITEYLEMAKENEITYSCRSSSSTTTSSRWKEDEAWWKYCQTRSEWVRGAELGTVTLPRNWKSMRDCKPKYPGQIVS